MEKGTRVFQGWDEDRKTRQKREKLRNPQTFFRIRPEYSEWLTVLTVLNEESARIEEQLAQAQDTQVRKALVGLLVKADQAI